MKVVCLTNRVGGIDELPGLAELDHALLEVRERPLHQHSLLLVVVQQVVPQRLLRQHLRVAHQDDPKPKNIQSTSAHFKTKNPKDTNIGLLSHSNP